MTFILTQYQMNQHFQRKNGLKEKMHHQNWYYINIFSFVHSIGLWHRFIQLSPFDIL